MYGSGVDPFATHLQRFAEVLARMFPLDILRSSGRTHSTEFILSTHAPRRSTAHETGAVRARIGVDLFGKLKASSPA